MKKIKYLLLLLPFLSGCYNYRELNEIGITTAISIDYDENFKVIAQVINPVKQQDASTSGEPSFVNFSSEGDSLQEAFRSVILESPRQLYGSHLQIIILSEEIVNNHLFEVLDFFTREPEIRSEVNVIIAQDPKDLEGITIQTLLNDLSSSTILDALESQNKKEGVTLEITLNDLTNMYLNPYLEITMPSMTVEGNLGQGQKEENITETVADAKTKIGTTAIFKENNLLGFLSIQESKMVNLIKNNFSDSILQFEYNDGYIVFEPNRVKSKVEADVKNNKVIVTIKGYAKINEVGTIVNLEDTKEIEKIKDFLNESIENSVKDTFNSIRDKYNTDIFGFQDLYYKTDPNYFKENYKNWYEDAFPNLEIDVNSNLKLYEKGNTLGGIEYERENK